MLSSIILVLGTLIYGKHFHYGIIFNDVPFTRESVANYKTSFQKGEKIYWLFMSKKPIKAEFIELQVVSATHKSGFTTLTGIVYSHDYRINKDNPHYYTDYVVIHSPGHYYMQIFDKNKLVKPLTIADFFVKWFLILKCYKCPCAFNFVF